MKKIFLWRTKSSDQGTEGLLLTDNFMCCTLELPWRNNQRNISCIPKGEYEVIMRKSPRFGFTYWITEVPNRSYILIHSGNVAGDVNKGYKTNVYGCILLGSTHGFLWSQRAVLNSRITIRRFRNFMENKPFKLNIKQTF